MVHDGHTGMEDQDLYINHFMAYIVQDFAVVSQCAAPPSAPSANQPVTYWRTPGLLQNVLPAKIRYRYSSHHPCCHAVPATLPSPHSQEAKGHGEQPQAT